MHDEQKSKAQLIQELTKLRAALAEKAPPAQNILNLQTNFVTEEDRANLKHLFDQLPIEVVAVQGDKIVYANQIAITANAGTKPEDVIGKSMDIFTPPLLEGESETQNQPAPDLQSPPTSPVRLKRLDGKLRWLEMNSINIEIAGIPTILSFGIDITDKIKTQELLEKQNTFLTEAESLGGFGSFEADLIKNEFVFSPGWQKVHGFYENNVPMEALFPLAHPDDLDRIIKLFEDTFAGKKPFQLEYRIINQETGEPRHIWSGSKIIRDESGNPIKIYGSIQDITQQKQAEEEVNRAYRSLKNAQRIGKTGNWEWNLQTGDIWWSDGMYLIYDRDRELGPMNPEETLNCIHPDDQQTLSQALADSLISGLFVSEYRISNNGKDKIISVVGEVTFNAEGVPQMHHGVSRDVTKQRQQEAALRESQAKYINLFQNSTDAFIFLDNKGNLIDVNPSACELSGYTYEELLALNIDTIAPDELVKNPNLIWENFIKSGKNTGETKIRGKDGNLLDISFNSISNILPGIHFVAAHDITEKKRAEAALKESEELLNQTGEMALVGGWEVDMETSKVTFTKVTKQIHEIPQDYDPSIGEGIQFFAPHHRPIISAAMQRALTQGIPYDLELEFITAKGNQRWVRTQGMPRFEGGKCVRFSGTIQDITERKKTQDALIANEQKYRTLFENTNQGILLRNAEGIYLDINPAGLEIFGAQYEDFIGKAYHEVKWQLLDTDDNQITPDSYPTSVAIKTGKPIRDFLAKLKNNETGLERWLLLNAIPQYIGESDKPSHTVVTFHDITSMIEAEATIKLHQQQLATLTQRLLTLQEEERQRISRDLHDETGQALSVVKIYLNLLENKTRQQAPELLGELGKVSDALNTAHDQIRNLAASLRPAALDLLGLSKSIEKLAQDIEKQTNLKFNLEMEKLPALPDKAAIALYRVAQEALNNILTHAKAKNIHIKIKEKDDKIVLQITDDGLGFDTENLKETHDGLGIIGMRERINALNGSLEIISNPGEGTQLTAVYPIQTNN